MVQVTQDDIDQGRIGDCFSCPVAIAVQRVVNQNDVSIGTCFIRVGSLFFRTPNRVKTFIKSFDRGEPVEPFEFELMKPYDR